MKMRWPCITEVGTWRATGIFKVETYGKDKIMKKITVTDRDVAKAIIGLKKSGANTAVIEAGINYLLRRFSVCRQMQKPGQDLHHYKPIQSIVREIVSVQRDDKKTITKLVSQSHDIISYSEAKHKELHNTGKLSDKTG